MKLIIKPRPYTQDIFVDTKLGRLNIRNFLQIAIKRSGKKNSEINSDAGIDHAQLYPLIHNDDQTAGQSLRTTFLLLNTLGYDIVLEKRNG